MMWVEKVPLSNSIRDLLFVNPMSYPRPRKFRYHNNKSLSPNTALSPYLTQFLSDLQATSIMPKNHS